MYDEIAFRRQGKDMFQEIHQGREKKKAAGEGEGSVKPVNKIVWHKTDLLVGFLHLMLIVPLSSIYTEKNFLWKIPLLCIYVLATHTIWKVHRINDHTKAAPNKYHTVNLH